ncbi:MAG TPA: hypothetical protein DEF57_00310 [Candidatus Magasanikbacteria bacterium]|nr:hypothetical protein [Candidatus Magasanikbacteria bacterium]
MDGRSNFNWYKKIPLILATLVSVLLGGFFLLRNGLGKENVVANNTLPIAVIFFVISAISSNILLSLMRKRHK